MSEQMKDKALLFLDRHIKKLEETVEVDHQLMAKKSVPYSERSRIEAQAEEAKTEYEAMMWVRDLVVSQGM